MDTMLQWGLDCIRAIQAQANPPLTVFMRVITEFGSATAYLVLLPFIYWCADEKKCLKLATVILISAWLNVALKTFLDQPRPFFAGFDPSLDICDIRENLGGLPSGHAQNSLVLWIILASWSKKNWAYVSAAVFCLLVGFSRIYLGVHFPTDVFGGWIIAGFVLCAYFLFSRKIENFLSERSPRIGLIVCAVIAFGMTLYRPDAGIYALKNLLMPAGMILGMGTGYFLCRRYIGFSAPSNFGRTGRAKYFSLAARFFFGITVMVVLYTASGKIVSYFEHSVNFRLYVFLRYLIVALWVSAGAPWLFRTLRLAEKS